MARDPDTTTTLRETLGAPQNPAEIGQVEAGENVGARRIMTNDLDCARRVHPEVIGKTKLGCQLSGDASQIVPGEGTMLSTSSPRGQEIREACLKGLFPLVPFRQAGRCAATQHVANTPGKTSDGDAVWDHDAPLIQHH